MYIAPWPWKTSNDGYVTDKEGYSVAEIMAGKDDEQQETTARLIAAAPDMLTALLGCDSAFAAWQVGQIPGRPEDILALIAKVRAAITKATEG